MVSMRHEVDVLHRTRLLLLRRVSQAKGVAPIGKQFADWAAEWKESLLLYATRSDGLITYDGLRGVVRGSLRLSEQACPDGDLRLVFRHVDTAGRGAISFADFMAFLRHDQGLEKQLAMQASASTSAALRVATRRLRLRTEGDVHLWVERCGLEDRDSLSSRDFLNFFREDLQLPAVELSDRSVKELYQTLEREGTKTVDARNVVELLLCTVRGQGGGALLAGSVSSPSLSAEGRNASRPPSAVPPRPVKPVKPEEPAGYLRIPGANRLNAIEGKLYQAGVDVRGAYCQRRGDQELADKLLRWQTSEAAKTERRNEARTKAYLEKACRMSLIE